MNGKSQAELQFNQPVDIFRIALCSKNIQKYAHCIFNETVIFIYGRRSLPAKKTHSVIASVWHLELC